VYISSITKTLNIMKAKVQELLERRDEIQKAYSSSTQSEIQLLISHYDNLHSHVLRYYYNNMEISDYMIDENYEEVLKLI